MCNRHLSKSLQRRAYCQRYHAFCHVFGRAQEPKALLKAAKKGGFWSYAAGVAYQMSVLFDIQGIQIDNYSTTLPIKKVTERVCLRNVLL